MNCISKSSSLIFLLVSTIAPLSAIAKGQPSGQAQAAQAQAMQAQQQAARKAQEEEFKAQQEQARQAQEGQARALEAERRNQEQALRAQEESARNAQMAALKAQQQQVLRAQEEQSRAQGRAQQEAVKAQQDQARSQQRAQEDAQREAIKAQQNQARAEAEAQKEQSRISTVGGAENRALETAAIERNKGALARPFTPKPVAGNPLPLNKAISMPILAEGANAQQQEHAQQVQQNLQAHLIALDKNEGPTNINAIKRAAFNSYLNNYPTYLNNQRYLINRSNTFVNVVPANNYPYWYQPEPNWVYANSFVYGSNLNCGLDWLQWGWHPYYGPPPEGFVCAADYVPTPWIYIPAYGVWRQPGLMGYAESGPPYDYDGPITVEVLEPRHVNVRDPYTGWMNTQIMNVVYMYNAYFYPEEERWGYMNRHGYFIWLNL